MRTRLSPLDLVAIAAVGCYVLAVLPGVPIQVSNVTGPVLCFVFTGLLGASAIFPRPTSPLVRFTAVLACALGAGMVGGLILNLLPGGLNQFSWATYGFVTTIAAYLVARQRGARSPVYLGDVTLPSWASSVKVVASMVIVIGAIVISATSPNANEKTFTELWLVPENPTRSPLRAVHAVLGVKSHESSTEDFTVVMDTGKRTITNRVTLSPNEVWTQPVMIEGVKATATLYRGGDETDQPYRTVWIAAR